MNEGVFTRLLAFEHGLSRFFFEDRLTPIAPSELPGELGQLSDDDGVGEEHLYEASIR